MRRCLAGDPDAWRQVHRRFGPLVVCRVRKLLGGRRGDWELVDELSERVWCGLVLPNDVRFRAFDPERGSLGAFFTALARQQIRLHRRAELRARARQAPVARSTSESAASACETEALLRDFLDGLPPALRRFCLRCLQERPSLAGGNRQATDYARKMQLRVRKRLRDFMRTK